MVGSFLAAVSLILSQQSAASKAAVDRSGEETFRKILEWAGSLKRVHGLIVRSFKDGSQEAFYPDGLLEFWVDGDKFRVSYGDMWGDGAIVVSDGVKVLDDSTSDPVVVRPALKCIPDCSPNLESSGTASSPFLYLLTGPSLLDRFPKDQPIYQAPPEEGQEVLVWDSTLFGRVRFLYAKVKDRLEVSTIEYDNYAWQQQMHLAFPEDFEEPNRDSVWRQKLVLSDLRRVDKDLFNVKPGRGREVQDTTKPPSN